MKRIAIFIVLLVVGLFAVQNRVTLDPDFEAESSNPIPCARILSPGIQVGVTDYDYSCSEGARWICQAPSGGYHFYWTYQYDGAGANRRASYNYYYPPSYWLGMIPLDSRVSRMGALTQLSDGRAVATSHANVGANIMPICYIDAAEGAGNFTIYDIPYPDPPNAPSWPKPCVDDADNIFVSGSGGATAEWTMSTDYGATWVPWSDSLGAILLTEDYFNSGGRERWTAYNGKICVVNNTDADAYVYYESIDHGATWNYDTIFLSDVGPYAGYIWCSAVYDNAGDLQVTFCVIDTTAQGGAYGSGWGSEIRHWNEGTGAVTTIAVGDWILDPGPGANHPTVSENQIAINRATGDLYCTWCQADTGADTSSYGYTNLEIYGAYSTDNGATWFGHHNITNSHTPGAAPGACDHDYVQSIAEETSGDTIYLFYMNDKDAGSYLMGEGGAFTDNPMLFYPYCFPVGIEEHDADNPMRLTFTIAPNPVSRSTKLSYALPSAGNISLKLYSVDGRFVKTIEDSYKPAGVYTLSLNTSDLASGTYFVVLNTSENTIARSVVLVH